MMFRFIAILILLFPILAHAKQPGFGKKLLPIFCMPIEAFQEGQKRVGEDQYVFGVLKNNPHMLFEIYKNDSINDPTFSVTLRKGSEICVLVAGTELLPVWWFEEKGLVNACEE